MGDPRYHTNLSKAQQQIKDAAVAQAVHEANIDTQMEARSS